MMRARKWEWRKRHRVWEANRKVFLFPENWSTAGAGTRLVPRANLVRTELG